MSNLRTMVVLTGFVSLTLAAGTVAHAQPDEVTVEEVKQFLDPTVMIPSFDYGFSANVLPGDAELYAHRIGGFWAFNHWTGVWADVPFRNLSAPGAMDDSGLGDVQLGWGAILHEDLESRFTTSIVSLEALAPTGDPKRGTGFGTWVLAPGGALAFNPTNRFPIYVSGRYLHSLGSLGGEDSGDRGLRVRTVELTIQTVHILPKGFFLSAIPSVGLNLNQDVHFFSLGLGAGRAVTRNFAVSAGYVNHVAGTKTFNQVFTLQLSFVFGERRDPSAVARR